MKVVPRIGLDVRDRELVPDACLGAALVAFHALWPCRIEAYINAVMYWSITDGKGGRNTVDDYLQEITSRSRCAYHHQ